MKFHLFLTKHTQKNQEGTASIVSALIIIILLSLISVGFAKIMSRSLQESLNSNLASAADYAAQSGINDTIAYIKAHGTGAVTDCNALNGSPPKKINYNISEETKYTCVLIDPTSPDLIYQRVDPYTSRVIDVSGAAKLMFSWESTDGFNNLPANGSKLLDETTWANDENAPILRLTLYASGNNLGAVDAKTYFLYPSSGGTNNINFANMDLSGTIQYVNCNVKDLNSIFNGSADKNCNLVVTGLPTSAILYARLTPLYAKTDIKIKGNTSSGDAVQFINQTKIDVTAQSSGATKRLQVRIDKDPVEIPEYALRTTNLLCKRITISPDPYGLDMDFGSDLSDTDCAAPLDYGSGGITEEE